MKKSMMVVISIICLETGLTNAGELKVDFDGNGGLGIISYLEAVKSAASSQDKEIILPEPVAAAVIMPARTFRPVVSGSAEEAALSEGNTYNRWISDSIILMEFAGKPVIANCLKQLLKSGTVEDKKNYILGKAYTFPQKFIVPGAAVKSRSGDWSYGPEYVESVTETREITAKEICVYVTTRFCRLACRIISDPPQTEECVKDCYDVLVKACDKFDEQPAPKK
ncbi:MAG: hypothetical protein A2270_06200 [Elusimicrobia bacterium RIFOXYA12_FULL_51_18]|nr:MAG: hypothetical protein A2270_06200 [Elusimicrobia bacterium RIFOXYA12_FULL_51_18]OGS32682.1 MAG: hypothetical protein A2218_11525 [Elusimicrobia bacterium RIFOXYA2_FULL_53_38]